MQIVSFLAGCDMGFWVLHKSRPSCGMGFWLGYRGSGCRRDQGGGEEGSCLADDKKAPPRPSASLNQTRTHSPFFYGPNPPRTAYYVVHRAYYILQTTDYVLHATY